MTKINDGGPDALPVELIDRHLDAVLRASGSALRHYSLPGTIDAMRKAMADAMLAERSKSKEQGT